MMRQLFTGDRTCSSTARNQAQLGLEELETRILMNVGPIAVSADQHHLIDTGNNQPFLYVADTAWDLFASATVPDAENYLLTRKNQGFTAIQASLAPFPDSTNTNQFLNTANAYGVTPFLNNDLGQPNPAYFSYVKQVLDYASQIGMVMVLNPFALSPYRNFVTPQNAAADATFVAQQLGGYNNIIWFLGGDLNPPDQANVLDVTRAEANAIRSNEPVHHLISYHGTGDNGFPHSSSEWLNNESWLDFNMIQGRDKLTDPDYLSAAVYTDYNRTPTRP